MKVLAVSLLLLGVAFAANPLVKLEFDSEMEAMANDIQNDITNGVPSTFLKIKVNEITDKIMEQVKEIMITQGLDPLKIPDIVEGFKFKFLLITYSGELSLRNGWLQDASTLKRNGNVTVDYSIFKQIITIELPLAFDDYMFNFDYTAKLMGLGPTGQVDAKVKNIEVFSNITIELKKKVVTLNEFKLKKMGAIKIKWSGHILVDWIFNILTNVTTGIFKGLINLITQGIVRDTLSSIIEYVNEVWPNL